MNYPIYTFKLITSVFFLFLSTLSFGQEICDNGIDDDGDGLIDLNDSAECFCLDTIQSISLINFVCEGGFVSLGTDYITGLDYSWYRDGIAQIAEEDPIYFVPYSYDGEYVCIITTNNGCLITPTVDVVVDDYEVNIVDTLCTNDVYEFNGQGISSGGEYVAFLEAVNGCDSIIHLDLFERDCGDTLTVTGRFLNNLIRVGVDVNNDGRIQIEEAMNTDTLIINFDNSLSSSLYRMTGFPNKINEFPNLTYLDISGHLFSNATLRIDSLVKLTHLDVSLSSIEIDELVRQPELEYLDISSVRSTSLDLSPNTKVERFFCDGCRVRDYDFTNMLNLKELLIEPSFDRDTILDLTNNIKLEKLSIRSFAIEKVDFSGLTELKYLKVGQGGIDTPLDLSNNNILETLILNVLNLEELDLSPHPLLKNLDVFYNNITTLDLSVVPLLEYCNLERNKFVELDFSQNSELRKLDVSSNSGMLELDFSYNHKLEYLDFESVPFPADVSIDLSSCYVLDTLIGGRAKYLNIKNGSVESHVDLLLGGNVHDYICVDEEQYTLIQSQINAGVKFGSYCDFAPIGESHIVEGNVRFDSGNDCTDASADIPMVKFYIEDDNSEGYLYMDQDNGYSIEVAEGPVTIIPQVANPAIFDISPEILELVFPDDASPFQQDFCITPKSTATDISVHIIPLGDARPGFESEYILKIENNGSVAMDGQLNFGFDSELMSYLGADIAASLLETSMVSWDYSNLEPFQSIEIQVEFLLNSPMDSPPLTSGDILSFDLESLFAWDMNRFDNQVELEQVVINSSDPNDKVCLEGDSILTDYVGEYVHYKIRFENIGTANATQVVIKDTIDLTMFQIETLVPLAASHIFSTRIRAENIVEFIFENIDLSFEEELNDGYVAFKIKTNQDLVKGDSLSNDAEIFFDFNFPIITNEFTTDIEQGGQDTLTIGEAFDFEVGDEFHYETTFSQLLGIQVQRVFIDDKWSSDLGDTIFYKRRINEYSSFADAPEETETWLEDTIFVNNFDEVINERYFDPILINQDTFVVEVTLDTFCNRPSVEVSLRTGLIDFEENTNIISFAKGLGRRNTSIHTDDGNDGRFQSMVYYKKGDEECGTPNYTTVNTTEIDRGHKISIYPNPVTDELNLVFESPENGEANLRVYDLFGVLKLDRTILDRNAKIETSKWTPGIYFVHFEIGNKLYTYKVIKSL